MFTSIAKPVASLRALPLDKALGVASVASFFWLLAQDRVHPLMVYLVELYLAF
ncbi:MAG: hypothetical protein K8H90_08655 [Thermoanaerobaculia bacterium]|nr:hypothetical protein [Thermoanaerobaculia bacterium]